MRCTIVQSCACKLICELQSIGTVWYQFWYLFFFLMVLVLRQCGFFFFLFLKFFHTCTMLWYYYIQNIQFNQQIQNNYNSNLPPRSGRLELSLFQNSTYIVFCSQCLTPLLSQPWAQSLWHTHHYFIFKKKSILQHLLEMDNWMGGN